MDASDDGERIAVDVDLPSELLRDIDEYAVTHGYTSPDDVVAVALEG